MLSANLRFMLTAGVMIYFILIIYFLRKKALELKYTLLWILAGIVMAVLIICPKAIAVIVKVLGIESYMNGLYILCIGFMIALLMSLTSIVSRHASKMRTIIQESAIMEKRIRELEAQLSVGRKEKENSDEVRNI